MLVKNLFFNKACSSRLLNKMWENSQFPFKDKINTQFVPRCEHFVSVM